MKAVGLIGVGLLGTAIAERLLADGHAVLGFDLNSERLTALKALGGIPASSVQHVLSECSEILLSLPESRVVRSLIDELDPALLTPGKLIIDTTTGSPQDAVDLASIFAASGVVYLDATIAGSSDQVRQRDAVAMVGGDSAGFERARGLLSLFTREQFYTGANGSGATVKLIVNLVLGLNRLVLAEGLALARSCGLDLSAVLAILKSGPAYSRAMDIKGLKMINEDFDPPQARLDQHWKDVRLILELGQQHQATLPLSELHERLLSHVSQLGFGKLDNSVIIRAFDDVRGQASKTVAENPNA